MKPTVLTGLRANSDLHIGNYFGALLPMIDMARERAGEYQVNLFVPDLHSFTTPIDHFALQKQIKHNLKLFVAAGLPLDNSDVHIYRQSYIPAHSELTWILDCFSTFGELSRMTQFKDKSKADKKILLAAFNKYLANEFPDLHKKLGHSSDEEYSVYEDKVYEKLVNFADQVNRITRDKVSVGLFNYPVLMAADILLYDAIYVPVGDDQTQHLEFTRDIAERLNNRFKSSLFTVPKAVKEQHEFFGKDQGLRIKDLFDPSKKMSKSDETGKGVVFLTDDLEVAMKKIQSATTDNLSKIKYDPESQPGISNLIEILALIYGTDVKDVENRFQGFLYSEFKSEVANVVVNFLEDFQEKLSRVDENEIESKLVDSEQKMNGIANQTLLRVQKAVGLR